MDKTGHLPLTAFDRYRPIHHAIFWLLAKCFAEMGKWKQGELRGRTALPLLHASISVKDGSANALCPETVLAMTTAHGYMNGITEAPLKWSVTRITSTTTRFYREVAQIRRSYESESV